MKTKAKILMCSMLICSLTAMGSPIDFWHYLKNDHKLKIYGKVTDGRIDFFKKVPGGKPEIFSYPIGDNFSNIMFSDFSDKPLMVSFEDPATHCQTTIIFSLQRQLKIPIEKTVLMALP